MQCRNFKFVLLSLICFLTLSCSFLELKQDYGELSFNLPVERTASDGSPITYIVTLKKPSGEIVKTVESSDSEIVVDGILKGNYSVVVEAYGPTVYFTGESDVTIVPKTRSTVSIVMKPEIITLKVLDYGEASNSEQDIWKSFETKHPQIKIERETLYGEDFHMKVANDIYFGKMADVFLMWPAGRSSDIHEKRLAKDLTPFMLKDGIKDDYYPACVNPKMQKGGYLAEIPFGLTSTNCMYVNKQLLAQYGLKPATTYEELKNQLPILKNAGKELIIMANEDSWVMTSCLFSMLAGRFGGKGWSEDIMTNNKSFTTSEPFRKAVAFVKQMYDDGVLSKKSLTTSYGEVPGQFARGEGAYLIDGDWRAGAFMKDPLNGNALMSPANQESDIELMQFPQIPGEVYHNSNSGTVGVGYGMSSSLISGSAKEKAAWELIKWLSGPEMQQRRLETGVAYPSLKEKFMDYDYLEPIARKRAIWYGTAETLTPVFDSEFINNIVVALNNELNKLGNGEVTTDSVCNIVDSVYKGNQITEEITKIVEPVSEGMKLTLPEVPGAIRCDIKVGNYENDELYYNIVISDLGANKTFIDKYVTQNKKYTYGLEYYNKDGYVIKTCLSNTETAIGGNGEAFTKLPVATYNQDTQIINFSSLPINDKYVDVSCKYRIEYNFDGYYAFLCWLKNNTADLNNVEIQTDYYGKNLSISSFTALMYLNNAKIMYSKDFVEKNELKDLPQTVIINDNRPEITATSTTEGVVIKFPAQVASLQNVACAVERTDSEGNYQEIYIDVNNLTPERKQSITDYFVDSGETYEYKARFMKKVPETGENWNWEDVLIAKPFTITNNKGGKGELNLDYPTTPVTAEYDQANLKITLNPQCPISVQLSDIPGKNKNMKARMWYERADKQYNWICALLNDKNEFDFSYILNESSFENYINAPLSFRDFDILVNTDGVQYTSRYNVENVFKHINGLDTEITLEDNRPKITATSTTEGVVINFPVQASSLQNVACAVERTDSEGNYQEIFIDVKNLTPERKKSITDYFVDSGETYEYKARFMKKVPETGENWNWENVLIAKPFTITNNKGGKGELNLDYPTTPVTAEYDQANLKITLNPQCPVSVQLSDIPGTNKNMNARMWYERADKQYNWICALLNDKNEFDFSYILNGASFEDYINAPLSFRDLDILFNTDGVQYTSRYNVENVFKHINGLDSEITLKDNRPKITATSTTEGILFTIPEGSIPTGATKFSIGRYNPAKPNDPTNGQMKYFYIISENPNIKNITDYFVDPGNTYEYKLYYRNAKNDVIASSKTLSVDIPANNCGYGEFKYNPETKVEVTDPNKGIIKLSPTPIYTGRYNDISSTNKNLEISLWYGEKISNPTWVGAHMSEDGLFDFSTDLEKHSYHYGNDLYPAQFCLIASIDGVLYQDILDATFSEEYNSPALVAFPKINVKKPTL